MTNDSGVSVVYTARFLKSLKKLPAAVVEKMEERNSIFQVNPFDSRLGAHKLHGRFRGFWAYSVDYRYRVIFIFSGQKTAVYYNIGDHSIYR